MNGRIVAHRTPVCPGHDSRFTVRHNSSVDGSPWWVHYDDGTAKIPANLPHTELVEMVNDLKHQMGQGEGGAFSINEHGQVIARMGAVGRGNAMHVVGLLAGEIFRYTTPITFGALDPTMEPDEGEPWGGPLCGMTYTFAAPGNPQPPSRLYDEIFFKMEGDIVQLSSQAGVSPYPPVAGPLATFIQALRRRLPRGGRFRVNEHGRAFTSDTKAFIGCVPVADNQWFRPLDERS